jgi:hypothetical protein
MPGTPEGIYPTKKVVNDPTREYVLANGYTSSQQRTLGTTIDDIEVEIDLETYDRMENDSAIAKSKKIIITNVLADDLAMAPGATEDEVTPDEYDVYVTIMEFCQRLVKGIAPVTPLRGTLEQLLSNSIAYGHGISEIVWEYRMDGGSKKKDDPKVTDTKSKPKMSIWNRLGIGTYNNDAPATSDPLVKRPNLDGEKVRLMAKAIKVKPRGAVRFVVDDFMNVLGMAPQNKGRYNSANSINYNEIIDRDKFLVLTLNKRDEDPRGRSTYRPAFNWYNLKSQVPAELLRFILEESVPKAVGTMAPNAAPFEYERDAQNNIIFEADGTTPKMLTAAESFARQIQGFRSGSGAVIPHEAKLEPFKKGITSDANLFPVIIKIINDEIENCILLQTLAQSEGSHQARSAAQQVAELLYNLIFWIKWGMAQAVIHDFLAVGVRANFGEWALEYLPQVSFGDFVRRDWTEELKAYADAYFKGLLDDTQRAEIMANLNLPKPGPSRQELSLDAAAVADVNGEAVPNPDKRPDKQPGAKGRNTGNGTPKKPTNSIGFGPRVRSWFKYN